MRGLASFLLDAWRLIRPYYSSEEKWSARGLLLGFEHLAREQGGAWC